MRSGPEPFDSPDAQALCAAQQAEMLELYEGEADIGPSRDGPMFVPPRGVFLVVRDEDGGAIACGGVTRFTHDENKGELKRMYVRPEARGRGLGRLVLDQLEEQARELGFASLVLETGDRQEAALALYERSGYVRIPSYPPYDTRELSLCFQKEL
ncbi:MAG: GNAT family N-acetyltransferase [Actinomycetota bacterium]